MTAPGPVRIRVNARAAAVHTATRRPDGLIDYPRCGAPGNTPGAAARFRPVETDDPVTCRRCNR